MTGDSPRDRWNAPAISSYRGHLVCEVPPATRCTSRTYAKTSFLALAARPHPLCGTANWVTGGLAGSPDKLLTASHQEGRHKHHQPARQTVSRIPLGTSVEWQETLEIKFHRRGWPFLFFLEVISPWSSPFPCLVPIAWSVAVANRSKGNFPQVPSSRRTGVNVLSGLTPKPTTRCTDYWAKSLGVSSRSIDNRHKSCRIGGTKTSMVQARKSDRQHLTAMWTVDYDTVHHVRLETAFATPD